MLPLVGSEPILNERSVRTTYDFAHACRQLCDWTTDFDWRSAAGDGELGGGETRMGGKRSIGERLTLFI